MKIWQGRSKPETESACITGVNEFVGGSSSPGASVRNENETNGNLEVKTLDAAIEASP